MLDSEEWGAGTAERSSDAPDHPISLVWLQRDMGMQQQQQQQHCTVVRGETGRGGGGGGTSFTYLEASSYRSRLVVCIGKRKITDLICLTNCSAKTHTRTSRQRKTRRVREGERGGKEMQTGRQSASQPSYWDLIKRPHNKLAPKTPNRSDKKTWTATGHQTNRIEIFWQQYGRRWGSREMSQVHSKYFVAWPGQLTAEISSRTAFTLKCPSLSCCLITLIIIMKINERGRGNQFVTHFQRFVFLTYISCYSCLALTALKVQFTWESKKRETIFVCIARVFVLDFWIWNVT